MWRSHSSAACWEMSAARWLRCPRRAISSFVVTPGTLATAVAAWWRRSCGRIPSGCFGDHGVRLTASHAALQAVERS